MVHSIKKSASHSRLYQTFPPSSTQQGLAYTPSQMLELTNRGVPISSLNVCQGFEGTLDASFDSLPPSEVRGYDIVRAWNEQQDARDKISKAISKDKEYQ